MKNRNKEMLPVRLESITVQIVLLIYSFEIFFLLLLSIFIFSKSHQGQKGAHYQILDSAEDNS